MGIYDSLMGLFLKINFVFPFAGDVGPPNLASFIQDFSDASNAHGEGIYRNHDLYDPLQRKNHGYECGPLIASKESPLRYIESPNMQSFYS